MPYRYYADFESKPPIRTDDGIRSRSQRGEFVKNWWAQQWIAALEKVIDAGRLRRGRSYARNGQVRSLEEKKGAIHARVQGSRPSPYKVTIGLDHLSDAQWEAVIDALAGRAVFAAQLLAGEMPQEIEEAFAAAGVSLFPANANQLHTECTCPDWANPCKHVAAAHYILGEQFDEDPFLLFRLRGHNQEQIIAALRARRSDPLLVAEEPADYVAIEAGPALDADLAHFWQIQAGAAGGAGHAPIPVYIQPPPAPRPVLKRLGQPPFVEASLEQLLTPALDAVTQAALETAFGEQGSEKATE